MMRLESVCTKCRMYRGAAKNSSTPMLCEVDGKVSDILFAPERLPKGCLMEDEYRSLLLRRLDKCMKCEHCKTSTALLDERYLCGVSDRWYLVKEVFEGMEVSRKCPYYAEYLLEKYNSETEKGESK